MITRHVTVGSYQHLIQTDKTNKKKNVIFRCVGEIIVEPANKAVKKKEQKLSMLVAIPSPRDIPEFKKSIDECLQAYDKVWFKYFHQAANPYLLIKDYFMKRPRYTHLAIIPDDLVINKQGTDKLIDDVASDPQKYRVIMGTCLLDDTQYGQEHLAFTRNLPELNRKLRYYEWLGVNQLNTGIKQAPHAGTPFAIISKDVMKLVSFDNDLKWNSSEGANSLSGVGFAEDVVLSNELQKLGIPIWIETGAFFNHLKGKKGIPM